MDGIGIADEEAEVETSGAEGDEGMFNERFEVEWIDEMDASTFWSIPEESITILSNLSELQVQRKWNCHLRRLASVVQRQNEAWLDCSDE